jgi:hypothetical protein
MTEERFDLNDLLAGVNIIANVLLIGKSADIDQESKAVDIYSSLVEITEEYASALLKKGGQLELNQSKKILQIAKLADEL